MWRATEATDDNLIGRMRFASSNLRL